MMLSNVGLVAFHYKSYGTFLILKKPYNSTVELPTTEIIEPENVDDCKNRCRHQYLKLAPQKSYISSNRSTPS